MKNCLVCQSGQDLVALNRIPVSMEGAPWGDFLVCADCFGTLGADQVKELIRSAMQERSFDPANVLREGESASPDAAPGTLDLPVSPALLRDRQAFARLVGEKLGAKLWELHQGGVSRADLATSLTPDGEGGYVFSAAYAPSGTAAP
jgi:hypothetical protein